ITGTPTTAIVKSFWIRVGDSQGNSGRVHTQITISASSSPNYVSSITVVVSPTSASVASGGTQQFSATVQGTSNTAVNWSASAGIISSSGLFTPPTVTSNSSVTITAKSAADSSQSASAYVTVVPPVPMISISVSPSSTSLASGSTQQFAASVQGTSNTAVSWSASSGTISNSGFFTAPTVTSNSSITVTATSASDPTQRAIAYVTVVPPAT